MELRFTSHALDHMAEHALGREDIEVIIANPTSVDTGETVVIYREKRHV